jgi:Asp-tRNA(Asn)/Glu-tRNA(Gln) amidotransferase A subunit family amidase
MSLPAHGEAGVGCPERWSAGWEKMPDPTSLSVRAAAREIAARRLAAEDYAAAWLERVDAQEATVGAWQYLDREQALAAARQRDHEGSGGPLHGIAIAVKDLIDTADMPTGYGSPIYEGHRPAADASCVALARAAGAVVLGKTVSTEFAAFFPGKTANPHNPVHTPGGSSSGSAAAVAAGMAPLAFGTQTAGSIIRPAAYCGVVGYKPSFGLVARAGVKALADSLDTVGCMARTVEDAAFFIGVLTDRRDLREVSAPLPPRFGLCRTPMWDEAEPATIAAFDRARAALLAAGARIDDIAVPDEHRSLAGAQDKIMRFEMARSLAWERVERSSMISPVLAQMLDFGMTIAAGEYDAARAAVAVARARLDHFFGDCAAIIVPAAPGEAPEGLGSTGSPIFNRMWTTLGVPCVTIPAGHGGKGLPVGIQLVGRIGEDARLMEAALVAERALVGAA